MIKANIFKKLRKLKNEYLLHVGNTKTILPKLPSNYQIEVINYCNLKCPICPSLCLGNIKKKWMRTSEFVKIADQLPSDSTIFLTNWGEPFLNPEIISIIKEGKKRGFILRIDSNFNFDSKLIPKIVDSNLDILIASIDGVSQETYEKYRQGGKFDLAWHNFSEIAKWKIKKGCSSPKLIWQFIVNRYNEHEIEIARKMASQLPGNIQIDFIPMQLFQEKIDWNQYSNEKMAKLKKEWLPKNKKYILAYLLNPKREAVIEPTRCPWLWRSMTISVNQYVTPCCHTYKPEHSFGNLNEYSLLEIWNNHAYKTSRKFYSDPFYKNCHTICSRCPNFTRTKESNLFIKNWYFNKWLTQRLFTKLQRK